MNAPRPQPDPPAAGPTSRERAQMSEFGISCDDTHYFFSGYRYERLADALNYARLVRERPELPSRGHAVAAVGTAAPTPAARELMADLGIAFVSGTFRLGAFRYDRLEDAVAYARQVAQRDMAPRTGR